MLSSFGCAATTPYILSRIEHVELAGEPRWTETSFLGGLKRLPIRYQARV
jgi:hypothetical protein